jgi:hypothetical protein
MPGRGGRRLLGGRLRSTGDGGGREDAAPLPGPAPPRAGAGTADAAARITRSLEFAAFVSAKQGDLAGLTLAVEAGGLDATRLKAMICGAEGNRKGIETSLLHTAVMSGSRAAVDYLIEERGCDPLAPDGVRYPPHLYAAGRGHLPLLQHLLARHAIPVDVATEDGTTALHCAAMQGQFATAKWLIGAGADVLRARPCHDGVARRPSELAAKWTGKQLMGAWLRQREMMAEAAARGGPMPRTARTLEELEALVLQGEAEGAVIRELLGLDSRGHKVGGRKIGWERERGEEKEEKEDEEVERAFEALWHESLVHLGLEERGAAGGEGAAGRGGAEKPSV